MAAKAEKIFTTRGKRFLFYSIVVATLIMIVVSTMASFSVSAFSSDAMRLAQNESVSTKEAIYRITDDFSERLKTKIRDVLSDYNSVEDNAQSAPDYYVQLRHHFDSISSDLFLCSMMAKDRSDIIVHSFSSETYESELRDIMDIAIIKGESVTTSFYSTENGKYCLAVAYPVAPTATNAITCYCGVIPFATIFKDDKITELLDEYDAEIFFVDNVSSGQVYRFTKNYPNGNPETTSFRTYFLDNGFVSDVEFNNMLAHGRIYEIKKGPEDYFLSDIQMFDTSRMDVVVLFPKYDLMIRSSSIFSSFVMRLGIVVFLIVVLITLALVDRWDSAKAEQTKNAVVPVIGCKTYSKFKIDAEKLILYNRAFRYVILSFSIANSDYIQGKYGEDVLVMLRKYIADGLTSLMRKNETFGYIPENRYVMLLQCETEDDIKARVLFIREIINLFPAFKKRSFYGQFNIGAYYMEIGERINMEEFVYRSNIAMESHIKNPMRPYIIYEPKLFENFRLENEIEARMNDAITNEEFYLFYQPKYNIQKDGIDGSEVLVRWYDAKAEGYISPAQFVPLFEKNGFINRLDRYVFQHVCEFLSQGVNGGEKVAPVSVNVSRVTAMKSDFVSYYVAVKNKYGIPNGFITLEFSETFSFTNIDIMRRIMKELHENGFHCSIDDFGVGYSSVLILKELAMDELKLDMSLLKMRANRERDEELLKVLVALGRVYNMKVTQEGVETEDQLEFVKSIGCDVVQGYYYSKPLLAYDFQDFINSGGSMKVAREKITSAAYKQPKYITFNIEDSEAKK